MVSPYFRSIESRFTLIVVIASLSFFGGIGFLNHRYNQREKLASLHNRINAVQNRLTAGLEYPLWEYNQQSIVQIVNGEMQAPEIIGISVSNTSTVVYGVQKDHARLLPLDKPIASDLSTEFVIQHHTGNANKTLGRVTLYLDLQDLQSSLTHDLWVMLLQFSGVAATIILAMSATLRGVVLRPLGKFDKALADIASGEADLSLRLPPNPTAEFARVTDSFNTFVEKLHRVMGGSIREVQQAISQVALNGTASETTPAPDAQHSVISQLAEMQTRLLQYQEAVRRTTEELRTAMQSAESANKVKGEFLANMSHEIRTPMNAILGLSALAMTRDAPEHIQDYLHKINQSADHLMSIINDILDLSKIEAGKIVIEAVTFDIRQVVQNVSDLLGEKIEAKGLALTFALGQDVPHQLVGDPLRMGQILINYVSNAIKFTSRGKIHIACEVVERAGEQVCIRLSVSDTGIGITEQQSTKLFQSFEQADASTTRQYGGTGLGLAISKRLAQAMAGDAGHSSEFGVGSTFWFTARVGIADTQTPQTPNPSPHPAQAALDAALAALHGRRVLLVEDNEVNQLVALEILESAGLLVDVAENGAIALARIGSPQRDTLPYDIVLMDMQMPVMDGITATLKIREMYDAKTLPVLAMTANAMAADRDRCLAAGMADVIVKPFEPRLLYQQLVRWISATNG